MPRTIQCPECGAALNVPPEAAGRRLKCPRCQTRMVAPGARVASAKDGPASGTVEIGQRAAAPKAGAVATASSGEVDLPSLDGDLRDTFDLPMMAGDSPLPVAVRPEQADALALFTEKAQTHKRLGKAEARAHSRRCPTCGGHVAAGMSICNTCGLDLESGVRIDLAEDLHPAPALSRSSGPPLGILLVGGVSFLVSLLLTVALLLRLNGLGSGFEFLALVGAFGVYASVQFLRGKSIKLLAIALTIGAALDVVVLVAIPIWDAQQPAPEAIVQFGQPASGTSSPDDEEMTGVGTPVTANLNLKKIYTGIGLLLAYAGVSMYLNSPPVRRHFNRA